MMLKEQFRKFKKDDHGSLSFFFVFILLVFTLITLFAIATPMLITINAEFYAAGQDMIDQASVLMDIEDDDVASAVADTLDDASQSTADQISILAALYQYSWIIIITVIALVIYIIARSTVEVNMRSGIV